MTTVFGTSDGGQHWWRGTPVPAAGDNFLSYQPDFTDARHGWLFGMQWTVDGDLVWDASEQLFRTSDRGRTWTAVRARLPLQGTTDDGDELCPDEGPFHVAFANQQDGWLTASTCSTIGIAPRVWRTTDGGETWTPVRLPAPISGWPTANETYSGVSVGIPWIVRSRLLVAVNSGGEGGLDIEESADGGKSWHLASQAVAGDFRYSQTAWFEPVDARHWIVNAPGEVIGTSDAGRTWHAVRASSAPPGGPFWFTSVNRGYAVGGGGITFATSNSGLTWSRGAAPPPARQAPGPAVTMVQEISPTLAMASGPETLRISRDGGRTWRPLPSIPEHPPLGAVQFASRSTGLVISNVGRQLWRTTDGGSTWTPLNVPSGVAFDHVQFWNQADGAAVTRSNGVYITTGGGRTWRPSTLPKGYGYNLFLKISGSRRLIQDSYPRFRYACFAGGTGWLVTYPPRSPERQDVLVSTDGGVRWREALSPAILHTTGKSAVMAWLAGCSRSQAWVEVRQTSYTSEQSSEDLLHTSDYGRTWRDVLQINNSTDLPPLPVPLSPGASAPSPQPAAGIVIPGPVVLPSSSSVWQTVVTGNGGIAFAVSADDGQHWQWHWFPAPRHVPRSAPASRSVLPAGLPWLATTATDARHAWVLFSSTNGSGATYLYATSDGGATWNRTTTFK